jgi:DNA-binding FadR family transcriptional regulator
MSNLSSIAGRPNVRVPKTAELVANHLRRQIVTHELKEGDSLPPETALMATYAISRPTLREAFRILESEGLINVRRGARGGARVQEPSADIAAGYAGLVLQHRNATLADVVAARAIVEAPAARMLAERRSRKAIVAELRRGLKTVPTANEHFHDFNALVVELTGNQTLILLTSMLERITREASVRYVVRWSEREDLVAAARRTRERLIELISAGDAEAAEDLWRRHLTDAGRHLVAGKGATVLDVFS